MFVICIVVCVRIVQVLLLRFFKNIMNSDLYQSPDDTNGNLKKIKLVEEWLNKHKKCGCHLSLGKDNHITIELAELQILLVLLRSKKFNDEQGLMWVGILLEELAKVKKFSDLKSFFTHGYGKVVLKQVKEKKEIPELKNNLQFYERNSQGKSFGEQYGTLLNKFPDSIRNTMEKIAIDNIKNKNKTKEECDSWRTD